MSEGAPVEVGTDPVERLLDGLNSQQREAVTHGEGPLLVLAGAGSGKTRVLTHRIAYLLATEQAHPSEILAITFTNKAAGEMRERVGALTGAAVRQMWVMTFHAACARILRAEATRLGYKRTFTIYDEADSRRMVKRCCEELGLDPKRYAPRAIKANISRAKNQLVGPEEYGVSDDEELARGTGMAPVVREVYELYEKRMREANAMDFDDLLVRTVNLLELFEDLHDRLSGAFAWTLVDEYQDTNHVQYRLLQLIAGEEGNLMVVGDDSQAVYGFRGADVRNILEFERDFGTASVVKLERNYRSTQTILDAANAVIANNRSVREKHLWTDAGAGERVRIAELADEHEEARWVAGEIEKLAETGVPRSEIACFYRTNAQSRVLEDTLVRFDVPYQVIGGTRFYDRAEIKDAMAYLSVLGNPDDEVAFARIVNTPKRGIGDRTAARIAGHANTLGIPSAELCESATAIPGLGPAAQKAVERFGGTMAGLRERSASEDQVAELLEAVLSESGLLEALEAEGTVEAEGRVENLRELVSVATEFDARRAAEGGEQGLTPLEQFLQEVALISEQDNLADDEPLVTLMTLHNAKGLEYDSVFVIGCEEGMFPHQRSVDEGNLEEERRLCYVGVTRARRSLALSYARSRRVFGASQSGLPSRFLGEIPGELVDRHTSPRLTTSWPATAERGDERFTDTLAAGGTALREPLARETPDLGVGDDVIHPKFGEGVVIDVREGTQVVVRFRDDGAERTLMTEYAPLVKAA